VLEQLTIADPQAEPGQEGLVPLPLELVTLYTRTNDDEPTNGRARVSFVRPSGLVQESVQEYETDLRSFKRVRQRARFAAIPIREPGRHVFRVELSGGEPWQSVANVPLEVVFGPAPR